MSASDTAVSIRNLSKSYTIAHDDQKLSTLAETIISRIKHPLKKQNKETFWALNDVSFDIKKGEVVGIIGRNGAGKSTLLKVLSRITEPTTGEIELFGKVGSLLEVGTGFHPELTGRENVYLNGAILGMPKSEITKQFDAIVDFAEVEKFLDTPVKRYSSGMYVRLAFAVAAHLTLDIMIVDEVLAVGDIAFQKKCLGKMGDVAQRGSTVLLVSHNMASIGTMCSRGVYLDRGKVIEVGPIAQVISKFMETNSDRSGSVDLTNFKTRRGSGAVQFTAARMLNNEGQTTGDFVLGSDLQIEFDLATKTPVGSVTLGVQITDKSGLRIANMVDFDANFNLKNLRSVETVRVSLSDIRLYPDRYLIGLFIGSPQGRDVYDWCEECIEFEVVTGGDLTTRPLPRSSGLFFLTPTWQLLDPEPA